MAEQRTRAFDPGRHLSMVGGKEYLEVKYRLVWFRSEYPNGLISTELVKYDDTEAVVKATVSIPDGGMGTGYGACGMKEFRDPLEKAETKAIGRALGVLGFGTQFCEDFDFGASNGRVVDAPAPQQRRNTPDAQSKAPPRDAIPQQASDIVQPDADWQRANKRLHAIAKQYGIAHESLSEWADHKHRVGSLTDLPAKVLDDLATALDDKTGASAETFLRKYAPVGVAQGQLVDAPSDVTRLGQ